MFYSHQLLARKAPLGQIWMAATMHAKINRRKLDKLNIITICEEILNPSVPMALRLSGILMGGVVIVYERKVKLLYDDVTRLVVEMNEAWKVKAAQDSTVLPKGKSQAKKGDVTLPDREETDVGEIEQSLNFSNKGTTMGFQQTAYFSMRLDSVDEPYINENPRDEDPPPDFHQADAANITLFERFYMYRADADPFNHFERFDIEGDEEMVPNFTSGGDTEIPTTLIPSPPPQDEPQRADEIHDQPLPAADEIHDQHPEDRANQRAEHHKEASQQDQQRKGPIKRKARKPAASAMDYEQTIILGHVYQSWLQNPSDIGSRKERKRKRSSIMSAMKIADLMELPPVALIDGALLSSNGKTEIHYPAPLLELWIRSTQPPHDSPSGRTSPPLPPEPSSLSPPDRVHYQDPIGFPFEDVHSGVGSQSMGVPMEKQRDDNNDLPTEIVMAGLRTNLLINGIPGIEPSLMVTPRNSGDRIRSIHSSAPEPGLPEHNFEVNSGRSNKKRPYSSSIHSGSSLEPVDENKPWQDPDPNFNLARLSENGLTPDQELLVETGPTQTQKPFVNHPIDQLTDSIRMQMKTHFDTPGVSQVESLNHLAAGMMRKGAAMLFYQTCVLASREFLRVEQQVPYGDILIFKGAKM